MLSTDKNTQVKYSPKVASFEAPKAGSKPRYVPPAPIVIISKRKAASQYKKRAKRTRSDSLTVGSLAWVIHTGESRKRGYQDYNRGSSKCRGSNKRNIALTNLTLKRIMKAQKRGVCDKSKLFAVTAWQLIPSTMKKAVKHLGLDTSLKASPRIQNHIFVEYLVKVKRPAIFNYIVTGEKLAAAGLDTSLEWASMQSPVNKVFYKRKCKAGKCRKVVAVNCRKGRGCYDGLGTNVAHTSYFKVLKSLRHSRINYIKLTKAGYRQNAAFALAVGINNL